MIEKRGGRGRWRRALSELQSKGKYRWCARGRQQWGEIKALTAIFLTVRSLPISGCLLGGLKLMGIAMRDRAKLSDE